ncbi:cytochrome b5 reductase 4 isoform X1 [Neodiprion virginianus]|uniref:cytochrome b5 reductase 4 isoform X1 n=2 Tax=Neodiprion virginianus TaxID=2961670 RepID=UPI001EE75905|nr:cytochrome b5 reductase 4 isoform X1 [Neodiprion virginianus]XP_046629744.1 cytochrome b5 reductase 4 isoform X1 [Neodiprion virginianus]XP_046629745.1 cytochrome b5 reductase 4 isoform X1 [Neodiprion virginianus]
METNEVENAEKVRSEITNSNSFADAVMPPKDAKGAKIVEEKLMKVNVQLKPPISPTSLLAQNIALLPTGVAKVKQSQPANSVPKMNSSNSGSSSASATGNPRNKTALAPGHSLMDWIRLGASGVDLTGVNGVPQNVTLSELARHNQPNDAWIAIRGIVYNVTRYIDFHPGGMPELMKGVGKDATKLFDDVHAWVNYQSILQKCIVGRLNRFAGETSAPPVKIVSPSSTSSGLLSRCIKQRSTSETTTPHPKMDWIQTSNTITLFYYSLRDHPAAGYQLMQITDSKYHFKFCFEKDFIIHDIKLSGAVNWPPKWKRNFESMKMEITYTKKEPGLWKTFGTYKTVRERNAKQRTYREYEVVSNTPLCKLVHLIVLRTKEYLEIVPIGRHVEAKLQIMGTDVSRMYTPVPPYLHPEDVAPNYDSDCICLMVKRYADGALTPTMTALKSGETLMLSNCLGTFTVENFQQFTIFHMLAAGTGLTAMLSIIQWALGRRNVSRINVLNFNKNEDSIFYSRQLDKVLSSEPRFTVTHILSHPEDSWTGRRGEISTNLLQELFGPSSQACVFSCGPRPFMQSTKKILTDLGWNSSQLHEFDD